MDSAKLKGKVAIVTGSSQGIGRAAAVALAQLGASVAITYNTSADAAQEVVDTIASMDGKAVAFQTDARELSSIRSLFDRVIAEFGHVDVVVSNAGGVVPMHSVVDVTEEEFDAGFSLNGRSHFFVMQMAAKTVRDGGRIIMTSSSVTALPYPGGAVYGGAKAAAELYVRVLAKELGPRGITVNAVSPGLTESANMRANANQARIDMVIRMTPLGRMGQPEDIADVIAFLTTDEARWITGQNFRVGGGVV